MNLLYSIFRPGGNDTALVYGEVFDAIKRRIINDRVMQKHPNVEQVGFVNLSSDSPELVMAGGEFCGNATRSTAWHILNGRSGEILVKVSGVESKLRAGVDYKGNAWAQMPIYPDTSRITLLDDGRAIVAMQGITHIVMNDNYPEVAIEDRKKIALQQLKELGLDTSVAASGVMFLTTTESGIKMKPVVFVRDINTLFYETACGSGTTAVGLIEALKLKKSVNVSVIQPTNIPISVKVDFDGKIFEYAEISGSVEKIELNMQMSIDSENN